MFPQVLQARLLPTLAPIPHGESIYFMSLSLTHDIICWSAGPLAQGTRKDGPGVVQKRRLGDVGNETTASSQNILGIFLSKITKIGPFGLTEP